MEIQPKLSQVAPADWQADIVARAPPTQQSLKSAETKKRLIEGAIRCIVKFGYSKTTTPRVAAEAGLSRGAMLHHFENGDALMRAVIAELHEKRLRAIRRTGDIVGHDVHAIVRTYWDQLSRPTFTAFHELSLAARTDKGLARILEPLQAEFRERRYTLSIEAFPEWQKNRANFDLALALSQQTIEGMAINRLVHGLDEAMVEPLLMNLELQIQALKPPAD
nr:TetR/AcrR family transcriptional regulator [Polymorphobacter sp.]